MPRNTKGRVDFAFIKNRIINELSKGDRFAFEIKDAVGIEYRQLWPALIQLESSGEIKRYFRDTPPSATLTFTLAKVEKQPSPSFIGGFGKWINKIQSE